MEFRDNPPAAAAQYNNWIAVAGELRGHPGQWGKIASDFQTTKAHALKDIIRHARTSTWQPKGTFEARTEANPDGTRNVLARYVGDKP